MGIPEGKEQNMETESLLKQLIDENFLNLRNKLDIQVEDGNRTPNYLNTKKYLQDILY